MRGFNEVQSMVSRPGLWNTLHRPRPAPTGQARLLSRHFFRRFFDNDLVSPNGDAHDNLGLVFALLAMPGLWSALLLLFKYNNPWVSPSTRLLLSVGDTFQLVAVSMIVMAVVTLVEWDALWLDGRDLAVLGPLPLSTPTLVRAKLRALVMFVGAFAVAVNAVPMVLYPLVLVASLTIALWRAAWLVLALAISLFAAAAFGFLAVLSARAVLVTLLGGRLFRRISAVVQLGGVFALTTVYLMLPGLSRSFAAAAVAKGAAGSVFVPPLWYLGLFEWMTGGVILRDPWLTAGGGVRLWQMGDEWRSRAIFESYGPQFERFAAVGVVVLIVVALAAIVLYTASQRRQLNAVRSALGAGSARRWMARAAGFVATRLLVRNPAAQATFMFTLQTVLRSPTHRLYLAGYVAPAFALAAVSVSSLVAAHGPSALLTPGATLLAIQFELTFFLLLGLRVAFAIPADLKSNWIFQLDVGCNVRQPMNGVSRALFLCVSVALGALAPLHALAWGWRVAVLHLGIGLLAAGVLIQILMLRLHKLPFTCSYLPGKANLKVYWPLYLFGFALYCYPVPSLEQAAVGDGGWGAIAVFLAVLLAAIAGWRRHGLSRAGRPVFEELPDTAAVSLDLTAG